MQGWKTEHACWYRTHVQRWADTCQTEPVFDCRFSALHSSGCRIISRWEAGNPKTEIDRKLKTVSRNWRLKTQN